MPADRSTLIRFVLLHALIASIAVNVLFAGVEQSPASVPSDTLAAGAITIWTSPELAASPTLLPDLSNMPTSVDAGFLGLAPRPTGFATQIRDDYKFLGAA